MSEIEKRYRELNSLGVRDIGCANHHWVPPHVDIKFPKDPGPPPSPLYCVFEPPKEPSPST